MTEITHPETGEVLAEEAELPFADLPNSARAQGPVMEKRAVERAFRDYYPRDYGGDFLVINEAIFGTVELLPHWIQNDADGHPAKYATLKQLMKVIRPAAFANGILIRHGADNMNRIDAGGGAKGYFLPVYTLLVHVPTGAWTRTSVDVPIGSFNAQAVGSAFTYGKRYTTLAAFGLATDDATDDDGKGAMPRNIEATEFSDIGQAIVDQLQALKDRKEYSSWREKHSAGLKMLDDDEYKSIKAIILKKVQDWDAEGGQEPPKPKRGAK